MIILFLYFIGWFVGLCLGSFFIIQPLIILCFSIPHSIKLKRIGAVGINMHVITRDVLSLILQIFILIAAYYFISKSHNLLIGFYVGTIMVFVLGISKIFKNSNNIADYMERNFLAIHPEFMDQYITHILENVPDSQFKTKHIAVLVAKSGK